MNHMIVAAWSLAMFQVFILKIMKLQVKGSNNIVKEWNNDGCKFWYNFPFQ